MQEAVLGVKEFSEGRGSVCPEIPKEFSPLDAEFVAKHILSELAEFLVPTHKNPIATLRALLEVADKPRKKYEQFEGNDKSIERIAEQADGLMDAIYYALDSSALHGINQGAVFDEVHSANMRKRWPDGTFHTSYGKIQKPSNFVDADVIKVIKKQVTEGSWPKQTE